MKFFLRYKCVMLCSMLVGVSTFAQKTTGLKIVSTFHIASTGGWDYLAIQPKSNRLFVSHSNQVNILDKTTGDSLGVIPNTTGVHGIAFIPLLNKGYTSNGRLNSVTIFDLKTFAVLGEIKTGENPDAIFYDTYSKKIITCNGRSKDLTIINPFTEKVEATIAVGGKPETAVSNNTGKIFVNVEDKNEIVVIDANKNTVLNHWSLLPGEAPTGLDIDIKTNRLFAACGDTKQLVVMDADNGTIIDKLTIGDGCDGAVFDNATKQIFTSNGEGTMTVIKEEGKDKFSIVETIPTKKGARTIALDEATHKIYLPTADFEPNAPKGTRAKMIAGSFQVLVLGK